MASILQWIKSATVALDDLTHALLVRMSDVSVSKDLVVSGPNSGAAIWTPASGKRIALSSLTFTVSADCTVTIYRGTNSAGNRLIHQVFKAGSGASIPYVPMFQCGTDEALNVAIDTGDVYVSVTGEETD